MFLKAKKHLFRRCLAFLLILNHLFVFCSQAVAIPDADTRHFHDIFGEESTRRIVQIAKNVPVVKGANGAYALRFDPNQEQEIIHFHDAERSVGTWIKIQGQGIFVGSKEWNHDIDIVSPLNLSFLKMEVGGKLRFLQNVDLKESFEIRMGKLIATLDEWNKKQSRLCNGFLAILGCADLDIFNKLNKEDKQRKIGEALNREGQQPIEEGSEGVEELMARFMKGKETKAFNPLGFYKGQLQADIESLCLSIEGIFSSQGSSQFSVQEGMNVLENGSLTSHQKIVGEAKSFFNRGTITAQDSLVVDVREDFANNGLIDGTSHLILRANTLVNRARLKAKTLVVDVKNTLRNIVGSNMVGSIEVEDELQATYKTFENISSVKVVGSLFSKGEKFENKRSGSSCGVLEVGSLYQADIDTYIDSGSSTWNGLALIRTQVADLVGRYTCSSASLTAEKGITARGGSRFQASHFLELKSGNGTLDFGGDLFLESTVKKAVFAKDSRLASIVAKLPHLINMEGCKQLTQRGTVLSTSSSISYSSDGKFDFTGRSRSGLLAGNVTAIKAQHANLDGILHSSGDLLLSIKESLRIEGEVAARNLRATVQSLFVSGSLTTTENAILEVERKAEVTSTGSMQIGKALAITSNGDVINNGRIQADGSVIQAKAIINQGSFSVETLAHFKADTYFANLWGGSVKAKDIQIDAALSLNLLSTLSATRSLTTNVLVDLNLLGLKTAHHITSSSLLSLDAGLSLPSLHPSDLLSWETVMKGLKAAVLSFSPNDVRSTFNLGFAAYNVCQQASTLYEKYSSLDGSARFSDMIPLVVGVKDLGFSAYTTAKNTGALVTRAKEAIQNAADMSQVKDGKTTQPTAPKVALLNTTLLRDAAGAAASVFMPSITQDSLVGMDGGIKLSGHVYQRGIESINTGVLGAAVYTNDALHAHNNGVVAGSHIHYSNTSFENNGYVVGCGDVHIKARETAKNTGTLSDLAGSTIMEAEKVTNTGTVSSSGIEVQAAVIGVNRAENARGGDVCTVGDRSSSFIQGEEASNSGSVSSEGVQSRAFVESQNRAESTGKVIATGDKSTASVMGIETTVLGANSFTEGATVLVGKKVVQTQDDEGQTSTSTTHSKKTEIADGSQIRGEHATTAGDVLDCGGTFKTKTASFESNNGRISRPQEIYSDTVHVALGQNGVCAQGAIELANNMTHAKKVETDASQYAFTNTADQTLQGEHRTFAFSSIDITAPLQSTGNLGLTAPRFSAIDTVHAAGDLDLHFKDGHIGNGAKVTSDGKTSVRVEDGGTFTLIPGSRTEESSHTHKRTTTSVSETVMTRSAIHGEQGMNIHIGKDAHLKNVGCEISASQTADLSITGELGSTQEHLTANGEKITNVHTTPSGFRRFFGAGDDYSSTRETTFCQPVLAGNHVTLETDKVTLQAAYIRSQHPPSIKAEEVEFLAARGSKHITDHDQSGYVLVSVTTDKERHDDTFAYTRTEDFSGRSLTPQVHSKKPVRVEIEQGQNPHVLNGLVQLIQEENIELQHLSAVHSSKKPSRNVSLTSAAKVGLALAVSVATSGAGSTFLLGASAKEVPIFVKAAVDAFYTAAVTQGATAGTNFMLRDKNWAHDLSVQHLALRTFSVGFVAGVGSALIKGFDPLALPNLFDKPLDHLQALGIRELGHTIENLSNFAKNPLTFGEWMRGVGCRSILAEIDNIGKIGAKNIGEKRLLGLQNLPGGISNLEHKFSHGFMALWTQGTSALAEGVLKGKISPEKFFLTAGAAALGAMGAEYIAEKYHDHQLRRVMENPAWVQRHSFGKTLEQISMQSRDMAKYATILAGMFTGNEEAMLAMHYAGARAVDNNFIYEALFLASICVSSYDTYQRCSDLYQVYQEDGLKEAGLFIAKDLGISLAMGVTHKLAFKVGSKVYTSARAALNAAAVNKKTKFASSVKNQLRISQPHAGTKVPHIEAKKVKPSENLLSKSHGVVGKEWKIERHDKIAQTPYGRAYRDPKTMEWWSEDVTKHGGSKWKVFKETAGGLEWKADADKHGNFIEGKHKGSNGKFIPWKKVIIK